LSDSLQAAGLSNGVKETFFFRRAKEKSEDEGFNVG